MDSSGPITFKSFIKVFKEEKGLDWGEIVHMQFMKLYEGRYKDWDLKQVASDIVEYFLENMYEIWKKQYIYPLRYEYSTYLLGVAKLNLVEAETIILEELLEPQNNFSKIYQNLVEKSFSLDNLEVQKELTFFLATFGKYIKEYSKQLTYFFDVYKRQNRRVALFFIIQFIFAVEKITIPRILIKSVESLSGSNYLLSPSQAHYRINPEKTIFLLLRNDLGYKSGGGAPLEKKFRKT